MVSATSSLPRYTRTRLCPCTTLTRPRDVASVIPPTLPRGQRGDDEQRSALRIGDVRRPFAPRPVGRREQHGGTGRAQLGDGRVHVFGVPAQLDPVARVWPVA